MVGGAGLWEKQGACSEARVVTLEVASWEECCEGSLSLSCSSASLSSRAGQNLNFLFLCLLSLP